jgi:hypothetical protein
MPSTNRHTTRKSRDGSSTLQQGGSGVSPLKSRDGSSTLHVSPFNQIGGLGKAHQLFGDQLPKLLEELNGVLVA